MIGTCSALPVGTIRESLRGKGALPLPPAGTKASETLISCELVVTAVSDLSEATSPKKTVNTASADATILPSISEDAFRNPTRDPIF